MDEKKESEYWGYLAEELKRISKNIDCGNYRLASFGLGHVYTLASRREIVWEDKEKKASDG